MTDPAPDTTHLDQAHPVVTARLGALFRIFYVNLILTVLTLGIYRFWGKTRLRRYAWRHVEIAGEGFEYHGTGKELLIGFLKALVVLLPFFLVLGALQLFVEDEYGVLQFVQPAILLGLYPLGAYAARRYRMSRTTWSGIRFRQTGSPWRYAGLYIKGWLLTLVSGSLYLPYMQMHLARYEIDNLHFGSVPFRFTGQGDALFKTWMLALLLLFPTGGLSLLWYSARRQRYVASQTTLDGIGFTMTLRGRSLLGFYLLNALILVMTLGIAYPVVIRRNIAFWSRFLVLDGTIDLAAVRQAERGPGDGEGLSNFLDMDFMGV